MGIKEQENASNTQRDSTPLKPAAVYRMAIKPENIQLIKNDLTEELFNYYSKCSLLSVDCEMMGLNPYRDRLCLVQLSCENQRVALIKIELNTLDLDPGERAPNLKNLFENPAIKKIFHFARTDLTFLYYRLGIDLKNVFCTKSASKLARTFTDKHSLKDLVKETLNVDIEKNSQLTDWGAPDLTKEQIKYAANDVLYLIPAHNKLVELLKRENRLNILEEVNKFLPTLAKLDLLGYTDFFAH